MSTTSFHTGELRAQEKAGTLGAASELVVGRKSSLNFKANHDSFLAAQSFAVVCSVAPKDGAVWVTPLFGQEGILVAKSENEIAISNDAIAQNDVLRFVESGSPLSLLAIDLDRRIRHRINGIAHVAGEKAGQRLSLKVQEYSPNCPKYINRRQIIFDQNNAESMSKNVVREQRKELTERDQALIQAMDTLWIGSYAPGIGADCNHRGGKPGFIRVTSPTTIEWPEYRGNGMFYTSGNLESHDRAGVTLIHFETGDIIQLTGKARVDWSHDGSYEGASRKVIFDIENLVRSDNVTSHRWKRLDYSPYNPNVSGGAKPVSDGEFPKTATLAKIVKETENVKTFRFVVPRQVAFLPGQYASFEFNNVPEGQPAEVRTWTLSETPNSMRGDNTLDITVKRIPNGLITNWLHDHAELGLEVKLLGIQGEMTAIQMDSSTNRPVVPEHLLLLSAGIGITPNLAMVRGIGAFSLQDETNITMIHVERNEKNLICQQELQRRSVNYPHFSYTNVISEKNGRITREMLLELVPDAQHQCAYVCGPPAFMNDMTDHLVSMGVPPSRIHTESFEF